MNVISLKVTDSEFSWLKTKANRSKYIRDLINRDRGKIEREETIRELAARILREELSHLRITEVAPISQPTAQESTQAKALASLERFMRGGDKRGSA